MLHDHKSSASAMQHSQPSDLMAVHSCSVLCVHACHRHFLCPHMAVTQSKDCLQNVWKTFLISTSTVYNNMAKDKVDINHETANILYNNKEVFVIKQNKPT